MPRCGNVQGWNWPILSSIATFHRAVSLDPPANLPQIFWFDVGQYLTSSVWLSLLLRTVPGPPTDVIAVYDTNVANTVTVSWTAPVDDGGAPILQYEVTCAGAGTPSITEVFTGTTTGLHGELGMASSMRPASKRPDFLCNGFCAGFTSLQPSKTYTCTVVAVNQVGPSASSEPSNSFSTTCFPGGATVLLESGTRRRMADLRLGDRVQVVDMATGRLQYSPVYSSMHNITGGLFPYLQLRLAQFVDSSVDDFGTSNGVCNATRASNTEMRTLRITANHFVYAASAANPALAAAKLVHAGKVAVGDIMWTDVCQDHQHAVCSARVVEVTNVLDVGSYAPQTVAGSIVVDGVLAHSMGDMVLPRGGLMKDVLRLPDVFYTVRCMWGLSTYASNVCFLTQNITLVVVQKLLNSPMKVLYHLGFRAPGLTERATRIRDRAISRIFEAALLVDRLTHA